MIESPNKCAQGQQEEKQEELGAHHTLAEFKKE